MAKELSNKLKDGIAHLTTGVPIYFVSTVCSYFSSEEYHKFLKDSSKGIIKAGIGILTNSEEIKRKAENIMKKATTDYPEIYQTLSKRWDIKDN